MSHSITIRATGLARFREKHSIKRIRYQNVGQEAAFWKVLNDSSFSDT